MRTTRIALAAAALIALHDVAAAQFGDGRDGSLTVTSTTSLADAIIFTTGAAYPVGTTAMTFVSVSGIAVGDEVLLIDTQGADVGAHEYLKIQTVGPTSATFTTPTTRAYSASTRMVRVQQFETLAVSSGGTLTSNGGILVIRSRNSVALAGTITVSGRGYVGGASGIPGQNGEQGDGAPGIGTQSATANGGGGGGGTSFAGGPAGGGGGGFGTAGQPGVDPVFQATPGAAGATYGDAALTSLYFGAGGGGGAAGLLGGPTAGGTGGGIFVIFAPGITVTGTGRVRADGNAGEDGQGTSIAPKAAGGGGAGGTIQLGGGTNGVTIASGAIVSANGGLGGAAGLSPVLTGRGGDGGSGRIRVDGTLSNSGTITPAVGFNGPAWQLPPSAATGWTAYE